MEERGWAQDLKRLGWILVRWSSSPWILPSSSFTTCLWILEEFFTVFSSKRHHDKADGWDVHMQMQVAHCGFLTNRSALRWSPYLLRHGSSRVACKIFFRSFLNTSVSRCCCWNTWSHVAGNTATFWARYPAPLNLATLILGHFRVEVRRGVENTPEEVQSSTLGQDLQDHEECVQFALKLEPWSLAQFFENL